MTSEKIGLGWTREEIVERFAKIIRNGMGPEFWQAPAPEWAVAVAETIWQNVEAIVRDRLETDRADIARLKDDPVAVIEAKLPGGWALARIERDEAGYGIAARVPVNPGVGWRWGRGETFPLALAQLIERISR